MNANMQQPVFGTFIHDKVYSLTISWLLANSITFSWQVSPPPKWPILCRVGR